VPKARIRNSVRRARFEHDRMSQQELATRVGCTRQTIVALELERYVPSLALAMRIAREFDCTIEELFQLKE
jgi:putative transcriptional regulator